MESTEEIRHSAGHSREFEDRLDRSFSSTREGDTSTSHGIAHYPSRALLDISFNTSLRSPRITRQNNNTGDFFSSVDENSALKPLRPGLLRQQSIQQSLYGSTISFKSADPVIDSLPKTNFYDDFTTIDWLDNSVKQSERISHLTRLSKKSFKNKILKNFDSAKSWILIVIISFLCACLAYCIDIVENVLIDLKRGYCSTGWLLSESACCASFQPDVSPIIRPFSLRVDDRETLCPAFKSWSEVFVSSNLVSLEFLTYLFLTLTLAYLAVRITLLTKTTNPLLHQEDSNNNDIDNSGKREYNHKVWYTAYGSGVPEVKTILSGFIIRKFLGTRTLICKATSLVLAIASGMALGKEGPYVHLSTCVGNICCRLFKKINRNELEKRQILSAAASAGVALAFGSPLGAVLFSIEEVTYYLRVNQLFHIFICAMSATLFLKFLNPYGTGKTVFFEVEYSSDWEPVELIFFIIIGIAGGCFGAMFCWFTQWWGKFFRQKSIVKDSPVTEVMFIALLTAFTTFYNKYTKIPTTELLFELASPCNVKNHCPILIEKQLSDAGGIVLINMDKIGNELYSLFWALLIKLLLTSVTFGLKLPAGIYVPSMVIGALFGRIFALSLQYFMMLNPKLSQSVFAKDFNHVDISNNENITCVDFGIYAMISAGLFMAGVTRMNVTLAAILFELTSSYTYVLPISISIAIANWVANMIEPSSLYELLIAKNDFPFLDNRSIPVFVDKSVKLADLIPSSSNGQFNIDITGSSYFPASVLKNKLLLLQQNSLLDGCLSILTNHGNTLLGLLPAPVLEFQLDKLERFTKEYGITDEIFVKLNHSEDEFDTTSDLDSTISTVSNGEDLARNLLNKLTDFTHLIDYYPVYLHCDSKLSLVYSIFSKLGNREICVLDNDGKFYSTLHKKVFIDYCKRQKLHSF